MAPDTVFPNFKAPKKPKKTKKQTIVQTLDKECGDLVRSRGRCEVCGSTRDLQWAHGFSRRYRMVRWDTRNGFCLDRGCHLKYTLRPLEWDEWLRARWGEALYAELRALALSGEKVDHKAALAALREGRAA